MNDIEVTTHESCADMIRQTGNGKLNQTIPESAGFDPRGGQRMTGSGGVPLILVAEDTLTFVKKDIDTLFEATEKLKELSCLTPPDLTTSLQIVAKNIDELGYLALVVSRLHRMFALGSGGLDVPEIFYDGYCDDTGVL